MQSTTGERLKRKLGLTAVLAIVMGDMIGSGIFFTPGQLAMVAREAWQVYFFWGLCGFITLCGALTLAEIASLLPRSGASYHALQEAFGPFFAFMQAWIMVLISGPGAIAGIAILFGEFAGRLLTDAGFPRLAQPVPWAILAIVFFTLINLRGVEWGGRTQVLLTSIKVLGLLALVLGALLLVPAAGPPDSAARPQEPFGFLELISFVGAGVAIVLFTYDGWIDASNVAGEVRNPARNFPLAMGLGVLGITLLYLLVNHAFLHAVSLETMQREPATVAASVAEAAFGETGGVLLKGVIWLSVFGALGGLIMTLPRLYYTAAREYQAAASDTPFAALFDALAWLTPQTQVPGGAILIGSGTAIVALLFFGTFSGIVNFFVVPFQAINMLMVASIFRLRQRAGIHERPKNGYRIPFYPLPPLIFIGVIGIFLVVTLAVNPLESLAGIGLTLLGVPVYRRLSRPS